MSNYRYWNGTEWVELSEFSGDYNDLTNTPTIITDHGDLSGLGDNDHPQYARKASAESITGSWDFRALAQFYPTTSGATIMEWRSADGVRVASVTVPVDGDINAPFVFNTSNAWDFQTDGSTALYINPAGDVGIGTNSPSVPLDVATDDPFAARFTRDLTGDIVALGGSGSRATVSLSSNNGTVWGGMWYDGTDLNFTRSYSSSGDLSGSTPDFTIGSTEVTLSSLTGTGDDLVEVNSSGDLSRRGGPRVIVYELDLSSPTNCANATIQPEWSSLESNNNAITLNSTKESVQFNESGWYRITVGIRINGNNRVELIVTPVRYDVTDDAAFAISEFETSNYALRDTDQNTGAVNYSFVKSFNADDELYFDVEGDADGTAVIQADGTFLIVEKLA